MAKCLVLLLLISAKTGSEINRFIFRLLPKDYFDIFKRRSKDLLSELRNKQFGKHSARPCGRGWFVCCVGAGMSMLLSVHFKESWSLHGEHT